MTADTDLFPVNPDFLLPLRQDFQIWVFWWEAVLFLKESFPLGLLAMKASVWSDLMRSAKTVTELTRLPGSSSRVFTSENKTMDTWEIDQSVTTTAILRSCFDLVNIYIWNIFLLKYFCVTKCDIRREKLNNKTDSSDCYSCYQGGS